MALKKNHKPAIWIIITIIMITLGCNLSGQSQNSSQDTDTPPENPTQEIEAQAEIPTLEATSPNMLPSQSSPSDNNYRADCLAGIFPGQTSRTDVIALLGEPFAAQQEGSNEALQFTSPMRGQYNTVYLLNHVVDWVSIVLAEDDPLTWSAIKAQYGEPVHTAYSDYLQGSRNFAFPEQGLNFIADPDLDAVFIQECFVPMSLEDYTEAYGDFLPQEDPYTK